MPHAPVLNVTAITFARFSPSSQSRMYWCRLSTVQLVLSLYTSYPYYPWP
jgi:hypothetical protein